MSKKKKRKKLVKELKQLQKHVADAYGRNAAVAELLGATRLLIKLGWKP